VIIKQLAACAFMSSLCDTCTPSVGHFSVPSASSYNPGFPVSDVVRKVAFVKSKVISSVNVHVNCTENTTADI
jgi:hypothetical protein